MPIPRRASLTGKETVTESWNGHCSSDDRYLTGRKTGHIARNDAAGDSIAYGFQASKFAAGLPPSGFDTGYVDVFAARLRTIRPALTVVNYGCPGESTKSFIAGPCLSNTLGLPLHDPFAGSQLDAALAFLRAHPGRVSPVTLTLWGNDIRELIASSAETSFAS